MSTGANVQFSLGQYRIGKSIGQGTFGKVRLGIHIPTGQKVAVKTLQKQKIVEQADIQRVTRQICILKILRHPNIIQLYEIIQTKTDIHLIMEYAEGGELFDYIVKKKRLDEKEAVSFMQQILAGVEYIHKNGIVHRDLKPQNLLLDHNKNIKIVDFGLSNQYKPGEKLKTACGSPCYAAPEMIAGKKYECLGADIWSCGIILYAMLCGYLPFEDPNTNKLYKKIMAGDFETPKILSQQSKDMLKNILNTNPDARFKVQQIRDTKWYGQIEDQFKMKGIIVGKDPIQPNELLLKKMQHQNIDSAQARTYIINNRHNQVTAHYYLLKIKAERDPNFQWQQTRVQPKVEIQRERRQDSPLIHRPDAKKDYYLPIRKSTKDNKQQSKNDSMNVSNIISSLVQANKNRIVTGGTRFNNKKDTNFDKLEEFKLFPNKKNSSIYQPNTGSNSKGASTQRSQQQQRSFEFRPQTSDQKSTATTDNRTNISINSNTLNSARNDDSNINKKRQQLSDQLKQISIKIDKQIFELRKQNNSLSGNDNGPNSASNSISKKRESFGPNTTNTSFNNNPKIKTQQNSLIMRNVRESINSPTNLNISRDGHSGFSNSKQKMIFHRDTNASIIKTPKIHTGPFNAQCIFMETAKILLQKITNLLVKLNLKYHQIDSFSLSLSPNQQISIQSVQGITGLHLIKFHSDHPVNQTIIQVLSK